MWWNTYLYKFRDNTSEAASTDTLIVPVQTRRETSLLLLHVKGAADLNQLLKNQLCFINMGISNFPPHLILLVFPLILIIDTTKAVAIHHERTLGNSS
jgi:hypothetical protein